MGSTSAVLVCVAAVLAMASHSVAFVPGTTKIALRQTLGGRLMKAKTCRTRPTSVLSMVSDEELIKLQKAAMDAPEGSEAKEKFLAAMKIKQQQDFDRSKAGPEYIPVIQKFKDENPEGWKAAQLVWLLLVVGTVAFPGAFAGSIFGGAGQ